MRWNLLWGGLTTLVLSVLGLFQLRAIREGSTYTRHLRMWLGIEPKRKRRWILGPLFFLFTFWWGVHTTTRWL